MIALLVYAGRLFGTRAGLAAVGKGGELRFGSVGGGGGGGSETLNEGGDDHDDNRGGKGWGMRLGCKVGVRVAKVVRRGLARSAVVAYSSRPRDLSREKESCGRGPSLKPKHRPQRRLMRMMRKKDNSGGASTPPAVGGLGHAEVKGEPAWGHIKHAGWSGPESEDLHDSQFVQFEAVVVELGGLVEAKAVSLAPMIEVSRGDDQATASNEGEMDELPVQTAVTVPDPLIVNLLRRPDSMGLRDYFAHLTTLGMIDSTAAGSDFLTMYERARFSGTASSETEFRTLMASFADLLRRMQPVREDILESLQETALAELDLDENKNIALDNDDDDDDDDDDHGDRQWADEADNDLKADAESIISTQTVNHTPQPNIHSTRSRTSSSSSSSAASISFSTSQQHHHRRTRNHPRSSRPHTDRYISARSTASSTTNTSMKKNPQN